MKNHVTFFVTLSFLIPSLDSLAQQGKIDSLQAVLSSELADTSKVHTLLLLSKEHYSTDASISKSYAHQALILARGIRYKKGEADALITLGGQLLFSEQKDSAKYFLERAYAVSLELNDSIRLGKIFNNFGGYHIARNEYPKALEYLSRAIEIQKALGNHFSAAKGLANVGMIYYEINELEKALQYYNEADAFYKMAKGDTRKSYSILYNNIGSVYNQKGDHEKALEYHLKSIAIEREFGVTHGLATALHNLGELYLELKLLDDALASFRESLQLDRGFADSDLTVMTYANIAEIHRMKKNFDDALNAADTARMLAHNLMTKRGEKRAYEVLAKIHADRGRFKEAYAMIQEHRKLSEEILNEEKTRQLAELQTKYETSEKEKTLIRLEKEKERQVLIRNLGILAGFFIALIAMVTLYVLQYRSGKKRELDLANLELARLKQRELKEELDVRSREVTSYSMNFIQKSEVMEELKKNLASLQDTKKDPELSKKIMGMNKILDNAFQVDKEWDGFKLQFEKVHPNFFRVLRDHFPDLTNGDVKLCSLLKLNFNIKESARILGISPESAKTARYRLRKKLRLNQEEDLVQFIQLLDENNNSSMVA